LIQIIAQQAQIKSLPITDIENLAEALLDFKGMADLEIWLRENVVYLVLERRSPF
jgi:hypothetical protein